MSRVVVIAARRTPIGRFLGALSNRSAVELAVIAGDSAMVSIDRMQIDLVVIGNVLSAGLGMNIARQIGVSLGVPIHAPAFTVNMMCASGMKSVMLACDAISTGEASVVLCGGTESMSNAPFVANDLRAGLKLGDSRLVDTILKDGLIDCFDHQHMGKTAERLSQMFRIDRQHQDEFALASQARYYAAQVKGQFDEEITSIDGRNVDEHPRPQVDAAALSQLKPVFDESGTVTAGNSSGINDGAAILVLAREEVAQKHGWKPLAVIDSHASMGCDPKLMGLGPVYAVRKLMEQMSTRLHIYDAIEINEAFAAQTLACMDQLSIDAERINPCGGAIAVGHPIGTSGARLIVHLAHRIARGEIQRGLATLCVGGGMGVAMSLSSVSCGTRDVPPQIQPPK